MMRCLAVVLTCCLPSLAETYLVSAGIEKYDDASISALQYAAQDAQALAKVYREAQAGPVYELLSTSPAGERPTRSRILAAFEEVRLKAAAGDTVVFFFAGHGVERDGVQYLLPYDTRLSLLEDTALPMRLLNRSLSGCRADKVLFIIDACRNDPQAGKGDESAELTGGLARGLRPKINAPADGRVPETALLLACDVGQRAWEWPGESHGAFTYFLLEALAGKVADEGGVITLKALAEYIAKELPAWCQRAQKPAQTPRLDLGDGGDIVLLKLPGRQPDLPDRPIAGNRPPKVMVETGQGVWHGRTLWFPAEAGPLDVKGTVEDDQSGVKLSFMRGEVKLDPLGGNRWSFSMRIPSQVLTMGGAIVEATDAAGYRDGVRLRALEKPKDWPAYLSSFQPPKGMDWSYFKVSPADGMPQVLIPGGEFKIGSPTTNSEKNQQPQRTIHVSDFWIDMHEVTVAQYQKFYQETAQMYPGDQMLAGDQPAWSTPMHPIVAVTNHKASAYAGWMARELPTEAQWEKAARSGLANARYPWGDERLDNHAVLHVRGEQGASPVCSKLPSPWGLFDLIGNASEWCTDMYAVDAYRVLDRWDPCNDTGIGGLVIRGGTYQDQDWTVGQREYRPQNQYHTITGFRCVRPEPYGHLSKHDDLTIIQSIAIQLQDAVADHYRETGKYPVSFDEVMALGHRTWKDCGTGIWDYNPANGAVRLME